MMSEYEKESVFSFSPAFRGKFFSSLYLICDEDPASAIISLEGRSPFEEVLFIGSEGFARKLHEARPELWIIGVAPLGELAFEDVPSQSRFAFCSSRSSVETLYGRLQNLFLVIDQWVGSLRRIVLSQGSIQDILDASETVLKNWISVSDANFKLVAFTKHIEIDDPRALELVNDGRHSEETIALFKRDNIMDQWEKRSRIADTPPVVSKYRTLDYVYRRKGHYFLHMIMHCNHVAPSLGLSDAFRVLVDHIDLCIKSTFPLFNGQSSDASSLIADLILHRPVGDKELDRRAEHAGFPNNRPMVVVVFCMRDGQHAQRYLAYYEQTIANALPSYVVSSYGSYVVGVRAGKVDDADIQKLEEVASLCACSVGVSDSFETLRDLPFAFRQAKESIEVTFYETPSLGSMFMGKAAGAVSLFSNVFAPYVFKKASRDEFIEKTVSQGVVRQIWSEDKKRNTNDAELLFAYVMNGNNLRKTSEMMFVHRSTLAYRIKRIEDTYDLDLDDAAVKLRLLVEYFAFGVN